jgi:hypothetical protein
MLTKLRMHLRAHVIGYLALFVALGGTAIGLPGKGVIDKNDLRKNVVKSKNVKNENLTGTDLKANTVAGADVNEGSLDFACTNGRKQFNDLCYEASLRAADSWESAFADCGDEGGQLPSLAELAAADDAIGLTSSTPDLWAGETWDDGANERASALDVGAEIPLKQDANGSHQYVCAFPLFK